MATKKKAAEEQHEENTVAQEAQQSSEAQAEAQQGDQTNEDTAEGKVDEFENVSMTDMVKELDEVDIKIDELRARRAKLTVGINRRLRRKK